MGKRPVWFRRFLFDRMSGGLLAYSSRQPASHLLNALPTDLAKPIRLSAGQVGTGLPIIVGLRDQFQRHPQKTTRPRPDGISVSRSRTPERASDELREQLDTLKNGRFRPPAR